MNKAIFSLFLLVSMSSFSQETIKDVLKKYNTESVPYIYVDSLHKISSEVILLDAREKQELK